MAFDTSQRRFEPSRAFTTCRKSFCSFLCCILVYSINHCIAVSGSNSTLWFPKSNITAKNKDAQLVIYLVVFIKASMTVSIVHTYYCYSVLSWTLELIQGFSKYLYMVFAELQYFYHWCHVSYVQYSVLQPEVVFLSQSDTH